MAGCTNVGEKQTAIAHTKNAPQTASCSGSTGPGTVPPMSRKIKTVTATRKKLSNSVAQFPKAIATNAHSAIAMADASPLSISLVRKIKKFDG